MALAAALAACGGSAVAPAIDRAEICAEAAHVAGQATELADAGYLGRALSMIEGADRSCSTPATRQLLARVYADLDLRDLAIEAYRRLPDSAAAIAELRARPSAGGVTDLLKRGVAERQAGNDAGARRAYARALAAAEAAAHLRARPILLPRMGPAIAAAFHPSGAQVALVSPEGPIELWDLRSARVVRGFEHPGATRVAFAPDGTSLASLSVDTLMIWDAVTGGRRGQWPIGGTALVFSPDARRVAVATADGPVVLPLSGGPPQRLGGGAVTALAFAPHGRALAFARGRELLVQSLTEGRAPAVQYSYRVGTIGAIAFHPDGATIAAGSDRGELVFARVGPASHASPYDRHQAPVIQLGFRPATGHLISLTAAEAKLWSLAETDRSFDVRLPQRALELSPDLRAVLVAPAPDRVELRALDSGALQTRLQFLHRGPTAVAVSPTGARVAVADGQQSIWLIDLERGQLHVMESDRAPAHTLGFSPDGDWLISAHGDGQPAVWDLGSRRAIGRSEDEPLEPWQAAALGQPRNAGAARGGDVTATIERGALVIARGGRRRGQVYVARDGAWLVLAADGRVDGSTDAQQLVGWQVGKLQLPGFVGWQRQQTDGLLARL